MATRKRPSKEPEIIETGSEPEYVASHVRFMPAGNGSVRAFVYKDVRPGVWRLECTHLIFGAELIKMGRGAMIAGADAHNIRQWEEMLATDPTVN